MFHSLILLYVCLRYVMYGAGCEMVLALKKKDGSDSGVQRFSSTGANVANLADCKIGTTTNFTGRLRIHPE